LGGNNAETFTPADTLTSHEDSQGLTSTTNRTYYYIVRAVSGTVKSRWSGVVVGMTKAMAPGAPTMVGAAIGQTIVRLTWAEVAGATGYELQFAELAADADNFEDDRFSSQTISLGASPTYYTHTGRKTGTRYTYRLRALLPHEDKTLWSGTGENGSQVVTKPERPDLTANATEYNMVKLSWEAVSFDDADLVADRTDYDIERRLSTATIWAPVTAEFVTDTCTAAEKTCEVLEVLVEDVAGDGSTRFFYRIRVELAAGDVGDGAPAVTSYWDIDDVRTPAKPEDDS
jgi:hypothetical protein